MAPIPDQLQGQSPESRRCGKHIALQLAGPIPSRLTAGGRIQREDQAAMRRRGYWGFRRPAQKFRDFGGGRLDALHSRRH